MRLTMTYEEWLSFSHLRLVIRKRRKTVRKEISILRQKINLEAKHLAAIDKYICTLQEIRELEG